MKQSQTRLIRFLLAVMVIAVVFPVGLMFREQNTSTAITNVMCENLYVSIPLNRMKPEELELCLTDPQKHLIEIRSIPVTSPLNVELLNPVFPLHNKFPLVSGDEFNITSAQMLTSDRFYIDTGSDLSVKYSDTPIEPDREVASIALLGATSVRNVQEASFEDQNFRITNLSFVNSESAGVYHTASKFRGVLGMDFFVSLRQFCFNMELALITPYCFGNKDVFGRFGVASGSMAIHIPVEFDQKVMYALFDTGYLVSTYYSRECDASDEFLVSDAFGNVVERVGTTEYSKIKVSQYEVQGFQYRCDFFDSEYTYLVLGSSFLKTHVKTIDFDFEDKVFTVSFRD